MFFGILEIASSSFSEFDQALKIVPIFIIENSSYIQARTLLTLTLTKHDREMYVALQSLLATKLMRKWAKYVQIYLQNKFYIIKLFPQVMRSLVQST